MGYDCIPALRRLKQEYYEFDSSTGYKVNPCLKNIKRSKPTMRDKEQKCCGITLLGML